MNQRITNESDEDERLTLVVPAKNEEEVIGETLSSLPITTLETMGLNVEVYVLDGNSEDRTHAIARRWGATVIPDSHEGKGAAFRHALDSFQADYVLMLDADGTYPPDAIPRVLGPLIHGDADVVKAPRNVQPGAMKLSHRAGNALLSLEASVLYARRCQDLCTGMWAFRGEVLDTLPLQSTGFELEAELFALTSRLDLRVERVPIDYLPRMGETNLSGRRDGWRIAWWLVRSRFTRLPQQGEPPTASAMTPSEVA